MRSMSWRHWILAAVFAAVGGLGLALGEEVTVRVVKDGGDELRLDVNGVTEVIRVDDLAEGESRTFAAGEHTITVNRADGRLQVSMDGEPFGAVHGAHGSGQTVWLSGDIDCDLDIDGDGAARKVIVMKEGAEGASSATAYTMRVCHGDVDIEQVTEGVMEGDLESLEEFDVEIAGSPHLMVLTGEPGAAHPLVVTSGACTGADVVRFRCRETGSELIVNRSDAIEDAYIDPATGCLMERVEEPEVHVVKIIKRGAGGGEGSAD